MAKKAKAKSIFWSSVVATYFDFAENTTIHGLKYTVEKENKLLEKILWAVIVFLGLLGSIFMLSLFWERFTSNPTRTSVLTDYAPTTAIPFPALTICNVNKLLTSKMDDFVDSLDLGDTDGEYLKKILPQALGLSIKYNYTETDLEIFQNILRSNGYDEIKHIVKQLGQNCKEMLIKCKWESDVIDCSQYFTETFTPDGLCCSFNYNSKNNYVNTTFFGPQMGLTVLIDAMEENVEHATFYSSGMKVIFHHPKNYPGFGSTEKILAVGRETLLQLSGTRFICSEDVRELSPTQRRCVYYDEHKLKYFPDYTEENCIAECRSSYIEKNCKCVPFYSPFIDKPICNLTQIPCLLNLTNDLDNSSSFITKMKCSCPVQCEDIFYDVLSTSTKFMNPEFLSSTFLNDIKITENNMLIHIFFCCQTQTVLLRDTVMSTVYLLSSFGGIFSLFLGCSFISGAEIIYYVCMFCATYILFCCFALCCRLEANYSALDNGIKTPLG